jgi:hypothetical protein
MRPINDVSGHNADTDVLIVQNGMKDWLSQKQKIRFLLEK